MRGVLLILCCSLALAFSAPSNWKLDELEEKLRNLFKDDFKAKEMPTKVNDAKEMSAKVDDNKPAARKSFEVKSISVRGVEYLEGVYCGYFEIIDGKSLYGFNTKTVNDITDEECMEACAYEFNFYCRSADYNYQSSTCYLSSENDLLQPHDFGDNFNTVYFRRSCEDPEAEEESSEEISGVYSGNSGWYSGYYY